MAEAAVNLVVEHLKPFLIEEAKLLKGVRGEVVAIKDEMESIGVLLRDADARAEIDEDVKVWVKQLRQVAFRMEDVMDEFRLRVAQQPPRNEGVVGWVSKTFGCVKRLKPRHMVASEIKEIKATLMQISERKEKYQLKNLAPGGSDNASSSTSYSAGGATASWRNVKARYADDMELVGIEKPKNQLTDWLVKGAEKRSVFAVVGTGGVGKTTLVWKVFDSDPVRSHFHYRAWVTVSQTFKIDDLLVKLISQFHESRQESFSPERVETDYLIEVLRNYLQNKRYVAILDDVWSSELWDLLKHALFDNKCGSRIMVTSRENGVALSFLESPSQIFCLGPLPFEDALILFYKTAFGTDFQGKCPLELEELSEDIVKRSGRLPLAIVAIGGLLLTKDKTVREWKKFHDSLSSEFGKDPKLKTIMKIISLSYYDLPYYLKSCFLSFGLIPEDCARVSYLLISMWIAEGFVKEEIGKTLEEVAEDYLDQLISRNLVQTEEILLTGCNVACTVHDLMHEFILSRITEENFCEVFDGKRTPISHESCRRLSIQSNTGLTSFMNNTSSLSLVRSVNVVGVDELPISFVHKILSTSTQLKILDLSGTLLESFPDEISNLFHLRYLDLAATRIEALPDTIGRLPNLETLFLSQSPIVELPLGILKLRKLRHITAGKGDEGVKVPEGIGSLTELQSLSLIDLERSPSLITDLEKLVKLRDLRITNLRAEDGRKICAAITKMNRLKTLTLTSKLYEEVIDLQSLSSPPSSLLSLTLAGPLEKLPDWVVSLSNLVSLLLDRSRLSHDAFNMLRGLSNLQVFILYKNAIVGEELHFQGDDFPKLKVLKLVGLDQLQSVMIEKGAMPLLKEMTIVQCTQLKVVPEGITHLSNLKALTIMYMPIDFTRRLEQDKGEDYWKVKHVPSIVIKWNPHISYIIAALDW